MPPAALRGVRTFLKKGSDTSKNFYLAKRLGPMPNAWECAQTLGLTKVFAGVQGAVFSKCAPCSPKASIWN